LLCLCRAVFIKTPATAGCTPAEYIASAVAPTETSVLLHRPADDLFDFARRSLRRPSSRCCSSFLLRRRRCETSPKSRLRPRMPGLSRHVAFSQGSNRGLCVVAQATGSNRRGTSTNALNHRVLCSTGSSLDGMIRSLSLPHSTINRKGERTMHFCKRTSDVALLLCVESSVPSSFLTPAHPFHLLSLHRATQARHRCPRMPPNRLAQKRYVVTAQVSVRPTSGALSSSTARTCTFNGKVENKAAVTTKRTDPPPTSEVDSIFSLRDDEACVAFEKHARRRRQRQRRRKP
jgi:hypothetical protein